MNAYLPRILPATPSEALESWKESVEARAVELAADLTAGKTVHAFGREWDDDDAHQAAADYDEHELLLKRLGNSQSADERNLIGLEYIELLDKARLSLARILAPDVLRVEITEAREEAALMAAGL